MRATGKLALVSLVSRLGLGLISQGQIDQYFSGAKKMQTTAYEFTIEFAVTVPKLKPSIYLNKLSLLFLF